MDFYEVGDRLAAAGALGSPAEFQGMLCGRLCGGPLPEADLMALSADFLAIEDDGLQLIADLIRSLYENLRKQLVGGQLGLRLLLPEDDEDMNRRLGALGDWCQGFLVGLGQGGIDAPHQLTQELNEVLHDLAAIARVDDEAELAVEDQSDESDYTELVEYVRVVAMMIFEELTEPDVAAGQPVPPTLH